MLDMPDVVGAVITRRRTIEPMVVTRVYCSKCQAEMVFVRHWVMGWDHKCPVCGVQETFDFQFPARRPLTDEEKMLLLGVA